jgi:glycosyltransferase involved in cell wall biosynthesis
MTEQLQAPHAGGIRPPDTHPLISIVTVVFRDCAETEKILRSIFPVRTPDLELIVIDGGSNDGTVELLQSMNDQIDYWISERDSGVYHAMNKGIAAARGEYLLHLNAGDRLLGIPWDELRAAAADAVDLVCCRVLTDGTDIFKSRLSLLLRIDNTLHHQGTFYRRTAHLGYKEEYHVLGDFEHNQRLSRSGCSVRQSDFVVADHASGGITTRFRRRDFPNGEHFRSVRSNFGVPWMLLAYLRVLALDVRSWLRKRLRAGSAA